MAQTLRECNAAGPCITLGRIVSNTPKAWVVASRCFHDETFKKLKSSRAAKSGMLHDEPCSLCRDHPRTQYPDEYMD